MITWGLIAGGGTAARHDAPPQFYLVRFLLGLGEAGFFPGVIIYLTHWFPSREAGPARPLSLFSSSRTPVAQMLGPKITGRASPRAARRRCWGR